jgi:hypothetical protein
LTCWTPRRPRAHESRHRAGSADPLKAQLTALDMEKQALLEDIAVGNSAHSERLALSNRTKSASSWNSTNWKRSTARS